MEENIKAMLEAAQEEKAIAEKLLNIQVDDLITVLQTHDAKVIDFYFSGCAYQMLIEYLREILAADAKIETLLDLSEAIK